MSNATYTTGTNSHGQITFTTFKVWTEVSKPMSKTFKTIEEATEFYENHNGARIDCIVVTILRDRVHHG
jgi:hypothetical protein